MKPMIKYRGGKSKEIPQIMWHVPRFTGRYIEPFLGGGAMFFYLEPREAIINDINTKLMSFYRGVRDDYDNLRIELDTIESLYSENQREYDYQKRLNPNVHVDDKNEELYYHIRDMYNGRIDKKYSDALLYYFINKTSYSGMIRYNAKGEFNVPFGRYQRINTKLITRHHNLLLKRSKLYNCDFELIFNMARKDDFIFLDPPYDCIFSDYGNEEYKEGFSEQSHRRLAEDFKNLPCKALMVIGRTSLTEELYKNYIIEDYEKIYSVNIRNRFKSIATHIIVANYRKEYNSVPDFSSINSISYKPEIACAMLFEPDNSIDYGKDK